MNIHSQRPQEVFAPFGLVAATLTTDAMPLEYMETRIYFLFSDTKDFSTLVTPSAGTVTITATQDGFAYDAVSGGTAMSVSTAAYNKCTISGMVSKVKVVPTGITGATYWKMQVVRT